MPQNVNLEIEVIKKFIKKHKQERYIQFVSEPRNRHKFINQLSHCRDFNWELFDTVSDIEGDIILATLRRNNVPDKNCYIISENSNIDTKTLSVQEAVIELSGYSTGTILVFGHADIIFYESETINTRYISKLVR